ncbi:glycoside hydrolase family 3 N-terminal domain-containing protein [Antribacter gilvus]|uniref:glycoside hydrolase family 3 N-terminal domain-containing protein n=1 Tax=Antribacter gilvus TaxID=2304675 RepID=UPI000F78D594|nr:glycoside hydrolase family 3 N-terminal domain-containing protein [Antribacter gilvus]
MTGHIHPGARAPALLAVSLVALVIALAACGGPSGTPTPTPAERPSPSGSAGPTQSPSPTRTPSPSPSPPDPLAGWTLEEKVGQLLMAGVDVQAQNPVTADLVRQHHVGNVFLAGRTQAGRGAVAALTQSFRDLVGQGVTHGTPLLVATDQEGGLVQVLRGDGFSEVPRATEQAALDPAVLQQHAQGWGAELAAAGINLDLAPVMDLVPAGTEGSNAPVGYFARNYGTTPEQVTASANAFSAGLRAGGVETVIKHFPGLGRVTANTDDATGVTDTVTVPGDPSVGVFAAGIEAGARYVMMSSAVYTQIDPGAPAVFSPAAVSLLRDDLGFDGVIMTDDLSGADQVAAWSPGDRAVLAVAAGVDLVLASADATVVPEMAQALVGRARTDPAFAARVDESARRVLAGKAGL